MKAIIKRLISLAAALCMLVSIVPCGTALAASEDTPAAQFNYSIDQYDSGLALYAAELTAAAEGTRYADGGIPYTVSGTDAAPILRDALMEEHLTGITLSGFDDTSEVTYAIASARVNYGDAGRNLVVIILPEANAAQRKAASELTGFDAAAQTVKTALTAYLTAHTAVSYPIVLITGHGFGAGVGSALAADITANGLTGFDGINVCAYLYGSPNASNAAADAVAGIYEHVISGDLIGYLPLTGWGYAHYGAVYSADLSKADSAFTANETQSVFLSTGRAGSASGTGTADVLNAISTAIPDADTYAKSKFSGFALTALDALSGSLTAQAALQSVTNDDEITVASNILDNLTALTDAHAMYTYVNALTAKLFTAGAIDAAAKDAVLQAASEKSFAPSNTAALKSILTDSTIWDTAASPDTWAGVAWTEDDGVYYVTGLDLSGISTLTGALDVSALTELTALDISGTGYTSVKADGEENLAYLNLSGAPVTEVTLHENASPKVICAEGCSFSAASVSALKANVLLTDSQHISGVSFSTSDVDVLKPIAVSLGFDAEAPASWSFVSWAQNEAGSDYDAASLNLSGTALTGKVDLTGLSGLKGLSLAGTSVTDVTLPAGLTAVPASCFYDCSALTGVTLPESITAIGSDAFYGCSALTELTLPAGIQNIGEHAFCCTALSKLTMQGDSPANTDATALNGLASTLAISVPADAKGYTAAPWNSYQVTAREAASPTPEPTVEPTATPTVSPTAEPTPEPAEDPTPIPEGGLEEQKTESTEAPTATPTAEPTATPTAAPVLYYTVTASAGKGGSVSPSGTVAVKSGSSLTLTFTPNSGYKISGVYVDTVNVGKVSSYTLSKVSENHTVTVTFTATTASTTEKLSIYASAGDGGSISPSGSISVTAGTARKFTITPDSGYSISDVRVDGISVGKVTSYTFSDIDDSHTISASFVLTTAQTTASPTTVSYAVTATSGDGGSITPEGTISVIAGESLNFSIMPISGYEVADVQVDGVSVGKVRTYTLASINADHTVTATFQETAEPVPFSVTMEGGSGGTVTAGDTSINAADIPEGTKFVVNITPEDGYQIVDVQVDGVSVGAVPTYTFGSINASHTVTAQFQRKTVSSSGSAISVPIIIVAVLLMAALVAVIIVALRYEKKQSSIDPDFGEDTEDGFSDDEEDTGSDDSDSRF